MSDDDDGGEGYSPIFYIMLILGIVGLLGFCFCGGALVGG